MRLKGGGGNGIKKEDGMRREKRVVNRVNETERHWTPSFPEVTASQQRIGCHEEGECSRIEKGQ